MNIYQKKPKCYMQLPESGYDKACEDAETSIAVIVDQSQL
jgi:hypothetical protein